MNSEGHQAQAARQQSEQEPGHYKTVLCRTNIQNMQKGYRQDCDESNEDN